MYRISSPSYFCFVGRNRRYTCQRNFVTVQKWSRIHIVLKKPFTNNNITDIEFRNYCSCNSNKNDSIYIKFQEQGSGSSCSSHFPPARESYYAINSEKLSVVKNTIPKFGYLFLLYLIDNKFNFLVHRANNSNLQKHKFID